MQRLRELFLGNRLICYLSLVLLGIVLIVWLIVNRRNMQECIESYRVRNQELARVRALEKRLESLREEKRLLESETEENEIAARNQFRMIREGERLVLVEREETGETK
jgi:cell division protein FtsB